MTFFPKGFVGHDLALDSFQNFQEISYYKYTIIHTMVFRDETYNDLIYDTSS